MDAGAMDAGTALEGGTPSSSTDPAPGVDLAMYGLPALHLGNCRLAVSNEDRQNAIDLPAAGWSSFTRLYGLATPPRPLPHAAFRTDTLITTDPDTRHDWEWGRDIASLALATAGATKVDQSAWWRMRETGSRARTFLCMSRRSAMCDAAPTCTVSGVSAWGPMPKGRYSGVPGSPVDAPSGAKGFSPGIPTRWGALPRSKRMPVLAPALWRTRRGRFGAGPAARRSLTWFASRALWRRATTRPNTPQLSSTGYVPRHLLHWTL